MVSLHALRDGLTDDSLRFAILLGLATIPFTLALSWEPVSGDGVVIGGSVSGEPLLLAGVIVGYRYSQRPTESRRAGLWTGLAGSIATVLVFVAPAPSTIASASSGMTVVAVVLTMVSVVLGVGFSALITMVSAMIVDRVTTRLRNRGGSDAGEHGAPSRWWRAVPVYALLVPVVLLSVLWMRPDSGVWLVASILGVLVLVVLAPVAFVGLFIDATEPRTDWIPSVGIYVVAPLAATALVYLGADVQGRAYPAGDAWYGFFAALWLTAAVYLSDKYRHTGTLQLRGG